MGITTKFILAEGLASGEHNKAQALTSARDASGQLAA
jgi:FMN-dependent NADH-azoreductase